MKNILSSLNESEKKRILEMHHRASGRHYLTENPTGATTTTQLGGGAAPGVMSIPDYNKFIVRGPKTGNYRFVPTEFKSTMINYLGDQGSGLNGIIGKTILITKERTFTYEKMGDFPLQNNNLDGVIVNSFVPKAWYVGAFWQNPTEANGQFLYLFSREITTNYSGDINKPFLEDGEPKEISQTEKPKNANLIIPTRPKIGSSGVDYYYPETEIREDIPKTLKPYKLSPGTDYIRIRLYDSYCPEFKGYADYLEYLRYGKLGSMLGVNKI